MTTTRMAGPDVRSARTALGLAVEELARAPHVPIAAYASDLKTAVAQYEKITSYLTEAVHDALTALTTPVRLDPGNNTITHHGAVTGQCDYCDEPAVVTAEWESYAHGRNLPPVNRDAAACLDDAAYMWDDRNFDLLDTTVHLTVADGFEVEP